MLGDGNCDNDCNLQSCSYDLADCCSCSPSALGQCSVECLSLECEYDEACNDQFMKDSAKYYQLLKRDFSVQLDFSECFALDSTCTIDDLRAFYEGTGEDLSKCQPEACFSQYGQTECCSASMHCSRCIGEKCLECEDGYYHFYTECVETCPLGYTTASHEPRICRSKLQTEYEDTSTSQVHSLKFVGTGNIYPKYEKTTLVNALAYTWNAYTTIIIIDSVVELGPMTDYAAKTTSSASIYSPLEKSFVSSRKTVNIIGNVCKDFPSSGCLEDSPEIRVMNRLMKLVAQDFNLYLENVNFNGFFALRNDCDAGTCSYCPYLTQENGYYYDDKYNRYESKPDWEECSDLSSSFIQIECGARLDMKTVHVFDFRLKLAAFIEAKGSLLLSDVELKNVSSAGSSDAFISQQCDGCKDCTLDIERLDVSYFNNGYEINQTLNQPSFLKSEKSTGTSLSNVKIKKSMVYSSSYKPFMYFKDPLGPVKLTQMSISDVYTNNALIYFQYSPLVTRTLQLYDQNSLEALEDQVDIETMDIQGTTAAYMVHVSMQDHLMRSKLYNIQITYSLAFQTHIFITSFNEPTSDEISGANKFGVIDGKNVMYLLVPIEFKYTQVKLSGSSWGAYALRTEQLANEKLSTVIVRNSGRYEGDLNAFTVSALINDSDFYMTLPAFIEQKATCTGTLSFKDSVNLNVSTISFSYIACTGNTGVQAEVASSVSAIQVIINGLYSDHTVSFGSSNRAAVIHLSSSDPKSVATLISVSIDTLSSSGVGAVYVTQMSLTAKYCYLKNITAEIMAGLACPFCGTLDIQQTLFEDVHTRAGTGGCIWFSLSIESDNIVNIQDSILTRCKVNAYLGAGIYFDNAPKATFITFSGLTFYENNSQKSGTAIYISSTALTSSRSSITNCKFLNNKDSSGSLIDIDISSDLAVTDCVFKENSNQGAVIKAFLSSADNLLTIKNTQIESNRAVYVLQIQGKARRPRVLLDSVTISYNQSLYGQITDVQLSSFNTTMIGGTNGLILTNATAVISNFTLSGLVNSSRSGIELYSNSSLDCSKCVFYNNTGNSGACIRVDSNSVITIRHSSFTHNIGVIGSALYLINSKMNNSIQDSSFSFNHATTMATVYAVTSNLTVTRVSLFSNTGSSNPGISIQDSDLLAQQSNFYSQNSIDNSVLEISSSSQAIFEEHCTFQDLTGNTLAVLSSKLIVRDAEGRNIQSFVNTQGSSSILIANTRISRLSSTTPGSFVAFLSGELEIASSQVSNFSTSAITVAEAKSVSITNSIFECKFQTDSSCEEYCAGIISNADLAVISNSTFRHLRGSASGGGLSLNKQAGYLVKQVQIDQSTFFNISGIYGGALNLNIDKALVTDSLFEDNHSTESRGGGIEVLCELSDSCECSLTNNRFINNSAKLQGGAVYWEVQPSLLNNFFADNQAEYGPDLASFGVSMTLLDSEEEQLSKLRRDGEVSFSNVASGQRIPNPLRIGLVDHYGQIVATDNSSTCDILPTDSSVSSVNGQTRTTAKKGVYEFSDIILVSQPKSTAKFRVSSSSISSDSSADILNFTVDVRDCKAGEAYVGDFCTTCASGTYSIDPNQSCGDCPKGAECYGGNLMVPKSGYWRSSKTTDTFIKCFTSSACLGSPNLKLALTGLCSKGYRGNLCQACDNGYSRSGENICSKCPSYSENIAKLIGIAAVICIVCGVMVRTSLKTAYEAKALHSIYIKIFTNYLQLVLITTQLDLNWPDFVISFFDKQNAADPSNTQLFSFDCYLAGENPSGDSYKQTYFTQLVLVSALPFIVWLFACLFWSALYIYYHKQKSFRRELTATAVILFFLIHPNLVKEFFTAFSCKRLDGDETWLKANLDIKCFDSTHSLYAFSVALPSIVVWCFGVPTAILCYLCKNHDSIDDLHMKCCYGFLYNGYKRSHFYWEFLILYRKILIICILIFDEYTSKSIQALTIMLLILVCLHLQYVQKPFTAKPLNDTELAAILVAGVTIYCGLYYLNDQAEGFKITLFGLMLITNAVFYLYLASNLLKSLIWMLASHIRFLNRFAMKQDFFQDAKVNSSQITRTHSYLTDEGKHIPTLYQVSEPTVQVNHPSLIHNLFDLQVKSFPYNSYNSKQEDLVTMIGKTRFLSFDDPAN